MGQLYENEGWPIFDAAHQRRAPRLNWRKWLDRINPFLAGNRARDAVLWKRHAQMLRVEGVPIGVCGAPFEEDDLNTGIDRLKVDMFDVFSAAHPETYDERERRSIERIRRRLHRRGIPTRGVLIDTPLQQRKRARQA